MENTNYTQKLKDLDILANQLAQNQETYKKVQNLKFDERAYVLQLAGLYKLYKIGGIDLEMCKKLKTIANTDFRQIQTELYFCRQEYDAWLHRAKIIYRLQNELTDQINSKSPEALNTALKIVDEYSRQHIFIKLYQHINQSALTDKDIEDYINHCDALPERADKESAEKILHEWIGLMINERVIDLFRGTAPC